MSIFLGLGIVVAGSVTMADTSGAERYGGTVFIIAGLANLAIGVAAMRERRLTSVD